MLKTAEDAGQVVCPYLRDASGAAMNCLGTGCMNWRWFEPPIAETMLRRHIPGHFLTNADGSYVLDDGGWPVINPIRPEGVGENWYVDLEDDGPVWHEDDASLEQRIAAHAGDRRGYCGAAGEVKFA